MTLNSDDLQLKALFPIPHHLYDYCEHKNTWLSVITSTPHSNNLQLFPFAKLDQGDVDSTSNCICFIVFKAHLLRIISLTCLFLQALIQQIVTETFSTSVLNPIPIRHLVLFLTSFSTLFNNSKHL